VTDQLFKLAQMDAVLVAVIRMAEREIDATASEITERVRAWRKPRTT
jgi:hypothetical protein